MLGHVIALKPVLLSGKACKLFMQNQIDTPIFLSAISVCILKLKPEQKKR